MPNSMHFERRKGAHQNCSADDRNS